MSVYTRGQATASRLLAKYGQGNILLRRTTTTTPDPDEPWNTTETTSDYTLDATVRRVEQKYVDGSLIVGTEDQVTFAVPAVTPLMSDKIVVDGLVRTVKDLRPMPAAGTVVAYIAFIES